MLGRPLRLACFPHRRGSVRVLSPDTQSPIIQAVARHQPVALRREVQARHVIQMALHDEQVLSRLQVPHYDRVVAQAPPTGETRVHTHRGRQRGGGVARVQGVRAVYGLFEYALRFPSSLRPQAAFGTYTLRGG